MTDHLTTRQVARRLGRSTRTVRDMVTSGRLKSKRDRATGALYIPADEVDRFEREELADSASTKDVRRPRRREPSKTDDSAAPPTPPPDPATPPATAPEPAPEPPTPPAPAAPPPSPPAPTTPPKKTGFGFW